jgi:hypothetical protein
MDPVWSSSTPGPNDALALGLGHVTKSTTPVHLGSETDQVTTYPQLKGKTQHQMPVIRQLEHLLEPTYTKLQDTKPLINIQ